MEIRALLWMVAPLNLDVRDDGTPSRSSILSVHDTQGIFFVCEREVDFYFFNVHDVPMVSKYFLFSISKKEIVDRKKPEPSPTSTQND